MAEPPTQAPAVATHARGTEEFGRVLAFSDGIFAIAMTLLVIGITVPSLADVESVGELADRLNDRSEEIVSFFISFAVIGRYWVAHHDMVALLAGFDRTLIATNLVYLALIAFLPFPTALLGDYFQNPLSVSIYAVTIALVSALEVVLFRHAYRNQLLREGMPADVYRWGTAQAVAPVVFFLVSVPIAFASSIAAVACWFLNVPFGILSNRRRPAGAERFYGP